MKFYDFEKEFSEKVTQTKKFFWIKKKYFKQKKDRKESFLSRKRNENLIKMEEFTIIKSEMVSFLRDFWNSDAFPDSALLLFPSRKFPYVTWIFWVWKFFSTSFSVFQKNLTRIKFCKVFRTNIPSKNNPHNPRKSSICPRNTTKNCVNGTEIIESCNPFMKHSKLRVVFLTNLLIFNCLFNFFLILWILNILFLRKFGKSVKNWDQRAKSGSSSLLWFNDFTDDLRFKSLFFLN